jgi:6-phosphogluconate dehydrogenase
MASLSLPSIVLYPRWIGSWPTKQKVCILIVHYIPHPDLLNVGKSIIGVHSIQEFVSKLKKPRRMMLLVQAGKAVDDFIEALLPFIEKGDIIIDGGNSHFPDSNRRSKYLAEKGIRFVGTGVSGGEEGARYGPSLMPGGNEEAWPYIKDVFQNIAAKSDGEPCCDWVGDDGAGHYVKMVHNGIEYGDMQLISEVSYQRRCYSRFHE